ncbi:hypothetical protein BK010_05810 [Tenericutes bacterium MO-XQ]|nr:hypothetical protein BK010_05810 [Tenericutes bacterium MO-XQ]
MKKDKELTPEETLQEDNQQSVDESSKQEKEQAPKKLSKAEKKALKEQELKALEDADLSKELDKKEKKALKKSEKKARKLEKSKQIKNRSKWTQKYFKKFSGREKDSFINFMQDDYNKAILRAERLSSINRNAYQKPIIITIPDAFGKHDTVHYRLDQKPDGTFTQIYDQALITMLFFGKETLFYYQANIDHRNGHVAYDISGEFNYFDVVHIETQIKYDNPDKPKYIMLDLEVGLSNGTKVQFHLRNHRIHDTYDLSEILTPTEQQILDMFKTKVRSEKSL